jgi:protein-disulfide isomerase
MFPRESAADQSTVATYQPLTDQQRAELEEWWAVQPTVNLPIPTTGEKVQIIKFSDYMCPACRQTFEGYKGVLAKYLPGGQVKFILKHYPLEAECNPKAPSNHYASCEAAAAVIMARTHGTAEKLEQWIFDHQPELTTASVKQAAKDVGGIPDFDAKYQQALQEVRTDASLGALLDVGSTPTFFINGRKVAQVVPPQYMDALIEMELKRSK